MKDEIREKRKHKRLGGYFANTLYGGMYREMRGGTVNCPEGYKENTEICGSLSSFSNKPCYNERRGICMAEKDYIKADLDTNPEKRNLYPEEYQKYVDYEEDRKRVKRLEKKKG